MRSRVGNRFSCLGAFTIVEVLVVVGLLVVLAALTMRTMASIRAQSLRTACAANMRQWGAAVTAYAMQNDNQYPYCDGVHLSWYGPEFKLFVRNFLLSQRGFNNSTAISDIMHPLYCPTQYGYRAIMMQVFTPPASMELAGYFYLPNRPPTAQQAVMAFGPTQMVYIRPEWVYRTRMGGSASKAPIMMDIAEQMEPQFGGWFDKSAGSPRSAHAVLKTGMPQGMNFLYEDGHVEWSTFSRVGVGATLAGNSSCYYDVPLE